MSSSNNHTNETITLKIFSELASVLDLESLQPGPSEPDDTSLAAQLSTTDANPHGYIDEPDSSEPQSINLASLMAQLAQVSTDLESIARVDARAREQATLQLAQYETLLAEREQA
jgi:hypothetical protein